VALVDLRDRQDEPEVRALIELGTGSHASAERARKRYADRSWVLVGWSDAGQLVGCVGVDREADEITLRTVAVAAPFQRSGHGRAMVEAVASVTNARHVMAETNDDAVGFYRSLGFTATPTAESGEHRRYTCGREVKVAVVPEDAVRAATLHDIEAAVRGAWGPDTSEGPDEWEPENPALGQCTVTALLLRELLGGEILIAGVVRDGRRVERHAWNRLPSGIAVDLTREQFRGGELFEEPRVEEPIITQRNSERYLLLEARVRKALGLPAVDA
jgi:N-acetylglutamate synthase-like GNAT family acetyltransferase